MYFGNGYLKSSCNVVIGLTDDREHAEHWPLLLLSGSVLDNWRIGYTGTRQKMLIILLKPVAQPQACSSSDRSYARLDNSTVPEWIINMISCAWITADLAHRVNYKRCTLAHFSVENRKLPVLNSCRCTVEHRHFSNEAPSLMSHSVFCMPA